MTSTGLLDLFRILAREPLGVAWAAAAWTLDRARRLDPVEAGLVALLLLALSALSAWALQRRWSARLDARARREGGGLGLREVLGLELTHSPLFLPLKPFQLLGRGLAAAGRALAGLARRLRRREAGGGGVGAGERPPEPPLLAASLGPTFLLAGLVAAALYLLGRLARPLIAAELGLPAGLSPWQVLLFGRRPELAWLLPLERHPYLGGLLAVLFWLAVWWTAASSLRLARHSTLGRNLIEGRRDPAVLPAWRGWAGAPELWRPAASYRRWAVWAIVSAAPFLVWGWFHLGGEPYRIGGSEIGLASVLWLSWALQLGLTGALREAALPAGEEAAEAPAAHGWPDVLAHLAAELQVAPPVPFPRLPAAEPAPAPADAQVREVLSPLLAELLERSTAAARVDGGATRLTRMQHDVLTVLALQGYVHTDPPVTLDHLHLAPAEDESIEDRSGHRSRNQVVLAPEGWGKTTLALLATANHALVHTRGSLVVTSTEVRAAALHRRFRRAVEPSTLRWNVRVREPGPDLMNDLSRAIVPDVVVTSLQDLVGVLLDRAATFAPFLRNLGLIVVDDVESFAGPIEVHAQLAFRRLVLRVEELTGVEELGGRALAAPQVLILGDDGMDEASEWAQSLCGVEAVTRRFGGPEDTADPAPPAEHLVYRLRDFRRPADEALGLAELVAACEALEVPWSYRLCGDARRDLGRGPLLLPEEPRCATDRPEEACVLLLEGTWSEVRRERRRLRRAGVRFARERRGAAPESAEPIALVTVIEPDLEMAFTQLDERSGLTATLRSLPRPVLRPPTGLAILPHMAAELTQHWTEVSDVVRVFGAPAAEVLQGLARDGLLVAEEQRDVASKANHYVRRVHVQALARAVRAGGDAAPAGPDSTLPAKVSRVELVSRRAVAVRDRTNLGTLAETDAASAHFVHYPGRIFQDARGTFVVVEHLADGGRSDGGGEPGGVLVEPILSDAVSSPRRRLQVDVLWDEDLDRLSDWGRQLRQAAGGELFGPEPVMVGRCPVALALRPVRLTVEHQATYRLGPIHGEVRQRSLTGGATRERLRRRTLETVALGILPNPRLEDLGPGAAAEEAGPRLRLGAARLLAAVMRAVLPVMVRGAAEGLGVALRVAEPGRWPEESHELEPDEGLFLFDADAGGNGTARAVYRDGVDVLLRLCRLVVERVLSLERLRMLHDEWASPSEILAEGRRHLGGAEDVERQAAARRDRDRALRTELLEWLDSRLRPEGCAEARNELERRFGSGWERGEGDLIDLGRCWASADGAVGDLVWAKHRWRRPEGGEALLDVGFDRRLLTAPATGETSGAEGEAAAEAPSATVSAQGPRAVHLPEGTGRPPEEADRLLYRRLHALAAQAAGSLGPLAARLLEARQEVSAGKDAGPGPTDFLRAFVQGIPPRTRPRTPAEPVGPAHPVETLLRREGDELDTCFLLAMLLAGAGLPSGVFVSLSERRAAAAVPDEAGADAPFWAEMPRGGGRLVPVPVGRMGTGAPSGWVFHPLAEPAALPGNEGGDDDV